MSIKYLTDNHGVKTDVLISYEDWQTILEEHADIKKAFLEEDTLIEDWQKNVVRNIINTTPRSAYKNWEEIEKDVDKEIL